MFIFENAYLLLTSSENLHSKPVSKNQMLNGKYLPGFKIRPTHYLQMFQWKTLETQPQSNKPHNGVFFLCFKLIFII